MLSFFRRIINSRAGVVITFITLGVIALAFAAGDVSGLRTNGMGGLGGNTVAKVGGEEVGAAELRQGVQSQVEAARQQQPTFDVAQFLAAGGLDGVLQRLIAGYALHAFGQDNGMTVSKRVVDGEIASIPAFHGPNGQFDQALYQSLLQQRRLSDAQVRRDIALDKMAQWLTLPTSGASQVPAQLALPYASLLLERRSGQIGFVPVSAVPAGPAPTSAELQTFYQRNLARYTVPQRRAIRYAIVTPASVAAQAKPTDAEVAQAYQRDRAKYAAKEQRTITQVIVLDQGGANALAARIRGGASVADAARAAGLEASTQTSVEKAAYAGSAGQAAADAAFSAQRGAVFGPVRGALGFVVGRVEDVKQVAGRTLEQARPEIEAALTKSKTADALGRAQTAIDDAITDRATFDEIVADRKLQPVATRPLLASGVDPDQPAARPDPAIAPIVQAAFAVEEGDAPQLVPVGQDGDFAVVALGQVTPAAPRPLVQIRDQVTRDLIADRSRQAARRVAEEVSRKVGGGVPLAQALAQTGLRLPAPRTVQTTRAQIAANPRAAEPALILMFSLPRGASRFVEAPGRDGWQIVRVDAVQPGNAAGNPAVIAATRADLARNVGAEYTAQFLRAVRNEVGVKVNQGAVARVRTELQGAAGQ